MNPPHRAVHWIIQANRGAALDVGAMAATLEADGHVAHVVTLERDQPVPSIPGLDPEAPLVCHGPGFLTRDLRPSGLTSGLFFSAEAFRWSAFRDGWGEPAMVAEDARVTTLAEAAGLLAGGVSLFVRPDADSKAFDGGVYVEESLAGATGHLPQDERLPVVVAAPRPILAEWRFFIVDRQVVGCSEYRRNGEPSLSGPVPWSATERACDLAAHWGPADVYCLDLAETPNGIGVVEANCFNASRFYGADAVAILRAVNAFKLARA